MSLGPLFATVDLVTGSLVEHVLRVLLGSLGVDISWRSVEPRSVDQRIARLDEARIALSESLEAIDELREDAEAARLEHATVLQALDRALTNKDDAEQKLASIRQIIEQNVDDFREVVGIPNVRKERVIGFISGVCASIFATAVWTWGPKLWQIAQRLFT